MDVEKANLVRACSVICLGRFHRVARVTQANEIHAFDHAAIGNIKAGNDPGFQHLSVLRCRTFTGKAPLMPQTF
jgi:hypothetical protein